MGLVTTSISVVVTPLQRTRARLKMVDAISLLAMGAAASGRRTRWTGAQPCSYTYAPTLPARAAVGAAGSGVLWPRPRGRRPLPWGPRCRQWMSSGTRTRAEAPLSPSSGCCRRYRAADASGLEAVGRFGVGLLGAWREEVAAALLVGAFIGAPTSGSVRTPRRRMVMFPTMFPTISGSCSLYHTVEALFLGAVGGVGGGMLGPRRAAISAVVATLRANLWPRPAILRRINQAA
jgi:hypothetical protein